MGSQVVTTIGLILDIIGVYMLYRYGFGGASIDVDAFTESVMGALADKVTSSSWVLRSHRERSLARKRAPWGLACLLVGFALQILAQWLPDV